MERGEGPRTRAGTSAHPDFSRAVLDDLFRYPRKHHLIAWPLWLATGPLGGHRFYLERTGTGVLMLLTGGGALLWWMIDAFLLVRMIDDHNREQARRERAGLAPLALAFMPAAAATAVLGRRPPWADRRSGRFRLIGDALVLLFAGTALGAVSAERGEFEALAVVVAMIGVTVFGARSERLARLPLLGALDRWSHRLRLYYHSVDPGGPAALLVRPVAGPVIALFRKRARFEVQLYLQLGAVFVIAFTLIDLVEAFLHTEGGWQGAMELLIGDMLLTFVTVYGFATPIGATLTTHLLLERTDRVLWGLSALSLAAIALGLSGG